MSAVHEEAPRELSPGEKLARDSAVSSLSAPSSGLVRGQNTPPHEETIKALQTQGMNNEFAAWTEASAPPLFDGEM